MKRWLAGVLAVGLGWAAWAQDAPPAETAAVVEPAVPADLTDRAWLAEMMRHLYRWHLDERDFEHTPGDTQAVYRVRRLEVQRDEGDRSEWAEIGLPQLGVAATVKKTDYIIEELGVEVRDDRFRIVNVARKDFPEDPPPGTVVVKAPADELREHLFRTRMQAEFPDAAMFERLQRALREHLELDPDGREAGEHVVHVAPLPPVANELWVFVENRKLLVRYSSDLDLKNPALWEHAALAVQTYDIPNETVVSLHEVPGSNEFLTRDQVGRALYNCIILGRRITVVNPD